MRIAEHFFSIQGEGATSGYPAYFIRLAGCNLCCGGAGTVKDKQLHNGASWRCDTIEVWKKENKQISYDDILENVKKYSALKPQVVITGGEPLMQQSKVEQLITDIIKLGYKASQIEVETNGTIVPLLTQKGKIKINCSPKLKNSGMKQPLRINKQALLTINKLPNSFFKFVVSTEKDVKEIFDDYINPFNLKKEKIYLMPACECRRELIKKSKEISKLCIDYGVKFSSRHQVMIWDKTTGV